MSRTLKFDTIREILNSDFIICLTDHFELLFGFIGQIYDFLIKYLKKA